MAVKTKKEEAQQVKDQNKIKEKAKSKKAKQIRVRIEEDFVNRLKENARVQKMSLNSYVNFVLNSFAKKEEIIFEETVKRPEKKEIESRVYFTESEAELLKKYAELNEWGISREVRFRTISSLAKKPKLSGEELKAIYSVRSSINVLGANVNRLIRNDQVLSDHNIIVCKQLSDSIAELQTKINWLIKCGNTHFKLKSNKGI